MARVPPSPPGPPRSAEELLARARRRGGQLRRRRRLLVAGGAAVAAGAAAAALVVFLPGPSPQRLQVVGSPPAGPACPTSAFRFSPLSPPQGGLAAGPGLAGNAFARLRSGQSVVLYTGSGQSITLTRGVSNEAFSVSAYSHGPKPLDEIQVLGSATYYYPPRAGLADGRIPFRYPSGAASVSDPCSRYQLVGRGVAEPALMATAERFQPLTPNPTTPTTTFLPAPATGPSSVPAVGPAADPVASPFNQCPNPAPLPFDPDAAHNALATARAAVPLVYTDVNTSGYQITASGPASANPRGQTNPGYYALPYGMCGPTVGARTYVVELYFPAMASQSTDLSHGQLFLSRFPQGWQAWYRYH